MKNISEQELLGKVRKMCPRTDPADVIGQNLEISLLLFFNYFIQVHGLRIDRGNKETCVYTLTCLQFGLFNTISQALNSDRTHMVQTNAFLIFFGFTNHSSLWGPEVT